jgi:hypothetical protein
MEFPGLPIIVSSFIPYKMPSDEKLLKRKVNPQYFVVIDMHAAKAYECQTP